MGTWGTWWEHFENLIRTQLRIWGTWWEHLENLIRTQLRTWGTYWEHFENLMGTYWEQTENNPTWNPFWLSSETAFSAAAEREREHGCLRKHGDVGEKREENMGHGCCWLSEILRENMGVFLLAINLGS